MRRRQNNKLLPLRQWQSLRETLKPTSLNEWLALLETRHPSAIDLGLKRVSQVAQRLDIVEPSAQVISVAGTNGKGSCIAILEALLLADTSPLNVNPLNGNKVGAYTSPHLCSYNERIRINAEPVADELICAAFSAIEDARGKISLTYFEFGTLAALWIFKQQAIDVVLLEVGLGGRLDAVNIVDADVAIVTSIDLDHQDWLGHDREAIGFEKVGIARANKPLVCGDLKPPLTLLAHLQDIGALEFMLGSASFYCSENDDTLDLTCSDMSGAEVNYRGLPRPQLPRQSALCALQALVCLGRGSSEETARRVFPETGLAGRFQVRRYGHHQIVFDVAHNPAACTLLAENLLRYGEPSRPGKIYGLFGALADKDIDGMLKPLLSVIDSWNICALEKVSRAACPEDIAGRLEAHKISSQRYPGVAAAWLSIIGQMSDNDLLVVFGSFYTVAQGLQVLDENNHRIG